MNAHVIKASAGRIIGISNPCEQPGKMLSLYDGTIVLARFPLDTAFPDREILSEYDGNGEKRVTMGPGIELDLAFATELRSETDGDDLTIYWY